MNTTTYTKLFLKNSLRRLKFQNHGNNKARRLNNSSNRNAIILERHKILESKINFVETFYKNFLCKKEISVLNNITKRFDENKIYSKKTKLDEWIIKRYCNEV